MSESVTDPIAMDRSPVPKCVTCRNGLPWPDGAKETNLLSATRMPSQLPSTKSLAEAGDTLACSTTLSLAVTVRAAPPRPAGPQDLCVRR